MWDLFKSLLTTDTAQWYETLPFVLWRADDTLSRRAKLRLTATS